MVLEVNFSFKSPSVLPASMSGKKKKKKRERLKRFLQHLKPGEHSENSLHLLPPSVTDALTTRHLSQNCNQEAPGSAWELKWGTCPKEGFHFILTASYQLFDNQAENALGKVSKDS